MGTNRLHKIMNRDGFVVETTVDIQMNRDDRIVIAHSGSTGPSGPSVEPVQFVGELNFFNTNSNAFTIFSLPFTVPAPPAGFQISGIVISTVFLAVNDKPAQPVIVNVELIEGGIGTNRDVLLFQPNDQQAVDLQFSTPVTTPGSRTAVLRGRIISPLFLLGDPAHPKLSFTSLKMYVSILFPRFCLASKSHFPSIRIVETK